MADVLGALLGLDIDDEEQAHALAQQLRREKMTNDYFALSSTDDVRDNAISRNKSNLLAATTLGKRRRTDAATKLTHERADEVTAYQRERNTVTDAEGTAKHNISLENSRQLIAKRKQDMEKLGEIFFLEDGEGNSKAYRYRPDGTLEAMPDYDDMTPHDPYANRLKARTTRKHNGVTLPFDPNTGFFYDPETGKDVKGAELDALAQRVSAKIVAHETKLAASKKLAEAEAGVTSEAWLEARNNLSSLGRGIELLDRLDEQIDNGADYTFTSASAEFESIVDEGLLAVLPDFKLSPTSDKDIKVARVSTIPRFADMVAAKAWVKKTMAARIRVKTAQELIYNAIKTAGVGDLRDLSIEAREKLGRAVNKRMGELGGGDYFEFTSPETQPSVGGGGDTTEPDAAGYIYQTDPKTGKRTHRKKVR